METENNPELKALLQEAAQAELSLAHSPIDDLDVAERIALVIAKVERGSQVSNAAYAGGWTSDEFAYIMKASPNLAKAVQLAEAKFISEFEIDVGSQSSNPALAKLILSSRGDSPLSDKKGHVHLDKEMEDESYDLQEDDLDDGFKAGNAEEDGSDE